VRWALKPQRLRHILSPICRYVDPSGQLEFEVVDAAAYSARGQRICASLSRVGWVDLSGRQTQRHSASRLVSFNQIAFTQIATYTRAYRAVVDFKSATATVPVMVDVVLAGRSRTEVTLTTSAPLAEKSAISAAELRLARLLVSRIRA